MNPAPAPGCSPAETIEWAKVFVPALVTVVLSVASMYFGFRVARLGQNHALELDERRGQREALRWRIERGVACVERLRELESLAGGFIANIENIGEIEKKAEILQVSLRLAFGRRPFTVIGPGGEGEEEDPDFTAAKAVEDLIHNRPDAATVECTRSRLFAVLSGYQSELEKMQERLENSDALAPPVAKRAKLLACVRSLFCRR